MRLTTFTTSVKFFSLIAIALLTFWATSSIVARTKSAERKPADQGPANSQNGEVRSMGSTVILSTRKVDPNAPAPPKPDPQERFDAFLRSTVGGEARLLHMDATTIGRQVVVSQSVHLMEKSPKTSYVWGLQVYRHAAEHAEQPAKRPNETLVSERYYLNQIFQVPADLIQMTPTFRETFELEPGAYRIKVTLHRIRPSVDLRQLTEQSIKQIRGGVSAFKSIVVAD